MNRSYKHEIILNDGKRRMIEEVIYPEWIRVSNILMIRQMINFYRTGKVDPYINLFKDIKSPLSERYKTCINRQVVGMLNSAISNTQKYIVKSISKLNVDEEIRIALYTINKANKWFDNTYKYDKDIIKVARHIFKFKFKLPNTSQECSSCHYVDKNNRKNQSTFECKCCGKKINADYNASKVIGFHEERFNDKKFQYKSGLLKKRTLITKKFFDDWVWTKNRRFFKAMLNNPYFKDYHIMLRDKLDNLS